MEELRRKQKLKKRLYSTPALVLLALVTFIFIRGTYIVFTKKAESTGYVTTLEAKEAALKKQQAELQANIESLKTEAGLEKEVKEKYNVAKEGEHVVILVDRQDGPTTTPPESGTWFKRMWGAIISAL